MARDVVHAAVMQNHGLTHIISADEHFDRIVGIRRLDVSAIDRLRAGLESLGQ